MDETPRRRRIRIVATSHVIKTRDRRQDKENKSVAFYDIPKNDFLRFMAVTALPFLDMANGHIQSGLCCKSCQVALEKGLIGSKGELTAFAARDYVNSREGFLKHFRWCAEAQKLWVASEGGTLAVEEPEFTR